MKLLTAGSPTFADTTAAYIAARDAYRIAYRDAAIAYAAFKAALAADIANTTQSEDAPEEYWLNDDRYGSLGSY